MRAPREVGVIVAAKVDDATWEEFVEPVRREPDPRHLHDGATPLIGAAEGGRVAMTSPLLKLGADVNARSASGWTAITRTTTSPENQSPCPG